MNDTLRARSVLNYTRGEQQIIGASTEPADRIPPLNGNVVLSYDNGGDYQLEGSLHFASGQERLSARDVRDTRIDPRGTPGWVTVGAKLQKEHAQRWQFSVALENLLDKRYRAHGSGLDAPGRNVSISARYTW
jgi:outer membrane receptor protein involved in Fe transport